MAGKQKPERIWLSRLLANLTRNEDLTITKRRGNAEKECENLLAATSKGRRWKIKRFKWERPKNGDKRHKLTVFITPRQTGERAGPPSDPPVPGRKSPPPSM